jgi:hypothetical protein
VRPVHDLDDRLRAHVARVAETRPAAGFEEGLSGRMASLARPNRRSWLNEAIAAAALVVVAAGIFFGLQLTRQREAVKPQPSPTAASLASRPMRLPTLSPGSACPVTSISNAHLAIGSPRGGPIFYLGGPNPKGGFPWNKTIYALIGARGPVLLRGARLDGSGTLKFDGEPANLSEAGETLSSAGGVTRTFYRSVLSPGATQPDGSTADVFYLYPSSPGCYALQADGNNFEAIVVFIATP